MMECCVVPRSAEQRRTTRRNAELAEPLRAAALKVRCSYPTPFCAELLRFQGLTGTASLLPMKRY